MYTGTRTTSIPQNLTKSFLAHANPTNHIQASTPLARLSNSINPRVLFSNPIHHDGACTPLTRLSTSINPCVLHHRPDEKLTRSEHLSLCFRSNTYSAHHRMCGKGAVHHLPANPQWQVRHQVRLHEVLQPGRRVRLELRGDSLELLQASERVRLFHRQAHRHKRLLDIFQGCRRRWGGGIRVVNKPLRP